MTLFGKTLPDYVQFQKFLLILTVGVGLVRLILPFAGASIELTRLFSINAVLLIGIVYYPLAVHRRAFGGYPQVLGLLGIQILAGAVVISVGILLTALTGIETIYSAPEFGGATNHWIHAGIHLLIVPVAAAIAWLPAALILFIAKRVS